MFVTGMIIGLLGGVVVGYIFDSFVIGLVAGVIFFFCGCVAWIQAMGDVNRATQHERDAAILDELQKLNNKDE